MSINGVSDLETRLNQVLIQIDNQIDSVQAYCVGEGKRADTLRDSSGNWVMAPLLAAKAQVLVALLDIAEVVEDGEER